MPFVKGQKGGPGRPKGVQSKKTIWLLESLQEQGFDYEKVLVKFLALASKGDKHALEMAHLLVKMIPHLANAPKQDAGVNQIETLVINRYDTPRIDAVETMLEQASNDVPPSHIDKP